MLELTQTIMPAIRHPSAAYSPVEFGLGVNTRLSRAQQHRDLFCSNIFVFFVNATSGGSLPALGFIHRVGEQEYSLVDPRGL